MSFSARRRFSLISLALGATLVWGGTAPGAGNVVSSNENYGIYLPSDSASTLVQGNLVGTNAAGTAALGSYAAVQALGVSNLVQVGGCKMPPASAAPMSPDERELLMTWLACGDPNN